MKSFTLKSIKHRLWIKIIIFVACVAVGAFVIGAKDQPLVDRKSLETVNFPVYMPKTPPEGFEIKKELTQVSKEVVSVVFTNPGTDKQITVTTQPIPPNFDMKKLIGSGSINTTMTPKGTLYDLSTSGNSKFLLNTGESLVFFTSLSPISVETINSMTNNLSRQ